MFVSLDVFTVVWFIMIERRLSIDSPFGRYVHYLPVQSRSWSDVHLFCPFCLPNSEPRQMLNGLL